MPGSKIEQTILQMAAQRGPDKTVCPSEVARALYPSNWRKHMDAVRASALQLQQHGKVLITQKGLPVDVQHIKGPVRIRIAAADQQL